MYLTTRPLLVLITLSLLAGCSLVGDSDEEEEVSWDTDIPESEAFDAGAATWGPGGHRIAFTHTPDSTGASDGDYYQLWTADLRTGERRRVMRGPVLNPDWSPDGQWFVFHSKTDPEYLFKVDLDGENLVRLTGRDSPNPELEYTTSGRWSPDGDQLLFTIVAGEPRGNTIMKADGTDAHIVVPYGISGAWFPGGQRFAYANWDMSQPEGTRMEIYVADADGSNTERLTDLDSPNVSQPTVSPDGEQIAFVSYGRNQNSELFLMKADGSDVRQITSGAGIVQRPEWPPNGDTILFTRFYHRTVGAYSRAFLLDVETLEVEPVFPAK